MEKRILLSSHYFPCITYFACLVNSNRSIIDFGEYFVKQSYRNRCLIYSANGVLPLSIPVEKKGKTYMTKVGIDTNSDWKTLHWRAISSAYNSSPFFEFYSDDLKEVFFTEHNSLIEFNTCLLFHICKEIGMSNKLETNSTYINAEDRDMDLRSTLNPKSKSDIVIELPRYIQIFEAKHGYIENLSILDLLFHEGPETYNYLKRLKLK
jgi:hypothetical protein